MPASEPGPHPRWQAALGAGLAYGLLTLLAFPTFDIWPLALLAPMPLIFLAVGESKRFARGQAAQRPAGRWWRFWRNGKRSMRTPLLVSLGALPMWAFQEWWLLDVTGPGFVPLTILLALFSGLFVWIIARLHVRLRGIPLAISVPIVWTSLEFFRGEIAFTGYPWLLAAHPLINAPSLAIPAAAFGVYFVSFLVAALAGVLAQGWMSRRFPVLPAVIVGLLAVLGFALGSRPYGPAYEPLRIAVVQTNLPTSNKIAWATEQRLSDFEKFAALTRQAALARPDLIVWPETMFPGEALDPDAVAELNRDPAVALRIDTAVRPQGLLRATEFSDRLLELQSELGIPMVVGAIGYDGLYIHRREDGGLGPARADARYNSAFLIDGGEVAERYDKIELTPFGEIMPYIHHWGWLQHRLLAIGARGMTFDLAPGAAPRVLELRRSGGTVALATPICFEATDADVVREIARTAAPAQPVVLLNLTNDGWFGRSDMGRWQHLQGSRWRSVEIGVPLVRAANTGVSAAFDAGGRVIRLGIADDYPARTEGLMVVEVEPRPPETFFMRIGNLFAWLVMVAAVALLVIAHRPGLHSRPLRPHSPRT
jgi:apolipoprotein N-acyltransferase